MPAPCREPVERYRLCGVCRLSDEIDGVRRCSRLVAESAAMKGLLARVGAVAASRPPVIIRGETGTGKEVLARVIHSNSPRQKGPFVAVNVAALPPELLESELFGHVKGAFTGAVSTTNGLFGEADGGTLLLDEIGEMPLGLQAKLLRVLQESEIRRVGETRTRAIDVRIISATHRDLGGLVASGAFREDLYYRLSVLPLTVPPLRERREDVLPLARSFAQRFGAAAVALTPRARAWLESYAFPGNVRELGNIVEHALVYARGEAVDLVHFPEFGTSRARPSRLARFATARRGRTRAHQASPHRMQQQSGRSGACARHRPQHPLAQALPRRLIPDRHDRCRRWEGDWQETRSKEPPWKPTYLPHP